MLKPSKSKIFLICLLSFGFGVYLAGFFTVPAALRFWLLAVSLLLAVIAAFAFPRPFWFVFLFASLALFGLWRYQASLPVTDPDKIWFYNGQEIRFTGLVAEEVQKKERSLRIELDNIAASGRELQGRVLVYTDPYYPARFGDRLQITCELEEPEPFKGFAYDRYLARHGIYSTCYTDRINRLAAGEGGRVLGSLSNIKNIITDRINAGLGEPEAGLARAIILADKQDLDPELKGSFSKTGLSHIAAISGMHISLWAFMLTALLLSAGLWRRHLIYAVPACLFAYILLIGFPASAVRAFLMVLAVLLGQHIGRINHMANALVLAGAVMLAANPKLLAGDIGFQLSFLAVLGIITIYPRLEDLAGRLKKKYKVKSNRALDWSISIFNITLSVQLLTWPVLVYNFKLISWVAPLANILAIWCLPFLLAALLAGIILSLVLPWGAVIFFLPARILLIFIIKLAAILSQIPGAFWEI